MVANIGKIFGNNFNFQGTQGIDPTSTTSGAYVSSTRAQENGTVTDILNKKFKTYSPESRDNTHGQNTYYLA